MKSQTIVLATSITAIALVAAFLGAMVLLRPASAQTNPTTTTGTSSGSFSAPWMRQGANFSAPFGGGGFPPFPNGGHKSQFGWFGPFQGPEANLAMGQTFTLTSTKGEYREVNDSSVNGTASGTLTFTVTGKLSQGFTLSLSSGSITIGSTQYTISSGSAQTGRAASNLEGQGTTSSNGDFIIQAQARGSFAGTSSRVVLDFSNGSTEYMVTLTTSVS